MKIDYCIKASKSDLHLHDWSTVLPNKGVLSVEVIVFDLLLTDKVKLKPVLVARLLIALEN